MSAKKIVIISDIHMSKGEPYSWLPTNSVYSQRLIDFFHFVAEDTSINELVLAGDIFDPWDCPIDEKPFTVPEIIDFWSQDGNDVIGALKDVVAKKPVYFIKGNHDIKATPEDMEMICSSGRCVEYITAKDYQLMHDDKLRVEHGHDADMFNAPCEKKWAIGDYPLGFFISRIVATQKDSVDWKQMLQKVVEGHYNEYRDSLEDLAVGQLMVKLIIDVLAEACAVDRKIPILFSEPELSEEKYTLEEVANEHYGRLLGSATLKYLGNVLNSALASLRAEGLDWYAERTRSEKGVPLVVFGHTHHAKIEPPEPPPLYLNDGCWSNEDKEPHYVTIDGEEGSVHTWAQPNDPE